MSIKGFPTQQKLVTGQKSHAEFLTIQPSADWRNAADVITRSAYRIGALQTAGAATGNVGSGAGTVIQNTSTAARPGDYVRFESGAAAGLEIPIAEVSTNQIVLAHKIEAAYLPVNTDTFYILRYSTTRSDSTGSTVVSLAAVTYKESVRLDYAITNVTTGAWVQLLASTTSHTTKLTMFDAGGYAMELGIGGAGSEVRTLLIPPGGLNGMIDIDIPLGSRISVKAIGAATVNLGEICINLLG